MEKIYIVAARRSAIGSNLGSLSSLNAADLGALVVKTMLSDANIPSDIIDECIVGNVLIVSPIMPVQVSKWDIST